MAFDGFTLKAVIQELQSCLIGGKITKIYQPIPDEIVLGIYSHGINYALSCNISSSFYSLHLTTSSKPNPLSAPNFCMLLRKYLIGFKIKDIFMTGLERIATIELEGYNELNDLVILRFIIELMGKHSNIILVNPDSIIIDSLKHLTSFSGSYRNILPGVHYTLPECTKLDISKVNSNFYNQISNKEKELSLSSYFMEHFSGTSKTLLEYSILKLNITENFNFDNFQKLLLYLQELIKKIEIGHVSCISLKNDYVLVINANLNNNTCLHNDSPILSKLHVNFFLDDYYAKKEQAEEFIQYRNTLLAFISKKLKKISKKLDEVNSKIQECSKMDEYQLYGELITSYLYKINDAHIDHIVLENYYKQNEPINIPLDITLSPADNAKKYFKKYHKLKNTIDIVTVQKSELEKEIDYLESIVYELQIAKNIQEISDIYQEMENFNLFSRKVQAKQGSKAFNIGCKFSNDKNKKSFNSSKKFSPRDKKQVDFLSYQIDGFTVLVGKNNQENDYLTMRIAKENDLWFHVKDMQGSHVILIAEQKEPSQEVINKVASISAYYSKARQSSNVPVDYTLAKYVKKPAKAKPGMVVYSSQKTVNVNPQKIAPGFQ